MPILKRSYHNNLSFYLKKLEKKSKINLKQKRRHQCNHLNSPTSIKETEFIQKKKSPGLNGSTGEFYQTFKEKNINYLHSLFQKVDENTF